MDMAGKVNRAFAVYRIPTGRIGTAEKLNFQSIAPGGLCGIFTNHFLGCLPGGPAWGTPCDRNFSNLTVDDFGIHFRRTKTFSITSQASRPGEAASGGWGDDAGSGMFFAGGHDRYLLAVAEPGQVKGQIRML